LEWTQTESVWDDYERMLVDAYMDWKLGIHRCGRHLSQSLLRVGQPEQKFVATYQECLGCKTEAESIWRFHKKWKERQGKEEAPDPLAWMIWTVYSQEEADEIQENQKTG